MCSLHIIIWNNPHPFYVSITQCFFKNLYSTLPTFCFLIFLSKYLILIKSNEFYQMKVWRRIVINKVSHSYWQCAGSFLFFHSQSLWSNAPVLKAVWSARTLKILLNTNEFKYTPFLPNTKTCEDFVLKLWSTLQEKFRAFKIWNITIKVRSNTDTVPFFETVGIPFSQFSRQMVYTQNIPNIIKIPSSGGWWRDTYVVGICT